MSTYTKTTWTNNAGEAIDQTNLNKLEQGVYDAHTELDAKLDSTAGHKHTGAAGDGPLIPSTGLAAGAATDTVIGNRTADQTLAGPGNTGTLTQLLSWIAGRIKAVSGTTNWYDVPADTIANLSPKFDSTTGHKHTGAAGDAPQIDPSAFATANWSAFRAYQSTSQALTGGLWSKAVFQTEVYDQGNIYDNILNQFKAPAAGFYIVSTWIALEPGLVGDRHIVALYVNGVEQTRLLDANLAAAVASSIGGSVPLKLAANDYVEVYVYASSGVNSVIGNHLTGFAAVRVA